LIGLTEGFVSLTEAELLCAADSDTDSDTTPT